METIKIYLENMFMNLPRTPEVERAKEELFQMMEDKYNELKASGRTENEAIGIVISEFGNLEEVAESLGISSYVHKERQGEREEPGEARRIGIEEARRYLDGQYAFGTRIGIGVALCIWSPIVLIILGGIADGTPIEDVAGGVGLLILFLMVAPAVAIFIYNGMKSEKFKYLQEELFSLHYEAENYVRTEEEEFQGVFTACITVGVVLCIISVMPIFAVEVLFGGSELAAAVAIGILLFVVSIGVFLFIFGGIRKSAYSVLLQKGEYNREKKVQKEREKKAEKVIGAIGGVYWSVVTCIYLLWSFLTMKWGSTWIIWPIAGVLFGAIASICNAVAGVTGSNDNR